MAPPWLTLAVHEAEEGAAGQALSRATAAGAAGVARSGAGDERVGAGHGPGVYAGPDALRCFCPGNTRQAAIKVCPRYHYFRIG